MQALARKDHTHIATPLLNELLVITCFRDSAVLQKVDNVGVLGGTDKSISFPSQRTVDQLT
jgi:hypothetical protein